MKAGGWIPIDKRFRYTLPKHRAYTALEAYLCFAIDLDEGREWSINGYAALWQWSRNKVRRFVMDLQDQRTGARHLLDNAGTGKRQEIRFISNDLRGAQDTLRTGKGQPLDRHEDTTKDPDPEPDPDHKENPLSSPSSEGKKPVKEISEEVKKVAGEFARLILENNPNNRELQPDKHEMTVERWAVDIDRMIRLDNRDMREIVNVVRWCQADDFWKVNILSGEKLRKQYDKLVMKMKAAKPRMACIPDVAEHSFHDGITEDGRF